MDLKMTLVKFREHIRYKFVCSKHRRRLKNKDFTWLSSTCTGAIITHELNCKFNPPTVNLYIEPKDFIKFVSNLDYYGQAELCFDERLSAYKGYPVAKLDDITIYFVHYHSEKECIDKWKQRYSRINKNNIFVMMSERDGCTYEDLIAFDHLPFKNKIVLTKKKYPEIKSAVYISGFEDKEELGDVLRMRKLLSLTKYYDDFDFVRWLNGEVN